LPTYAAKTFFQRKWTKCEQHVIENLIHNSLTGNEKWSKKSQRYKNFAIGDLIWELQTINLLQAPCQHVPTHRSFSGGKISKCELRTTETVIQNSFVKERVFLPFQRTILSNRTRVLQFSTGPPNVSDNKHFTSHLPSRGKHKISFL